MIRFRRVQEVKSPRDQKAFTEADAIFQAAFPADPYAMDRIERMLRKRTSLDFEPILLVAESRLGVVVGVSFVFYFPTLRVAYLQYIASDGSRRGRGIGGALFEAIRELLVVRGARGLFLDVDPDDPEAVSDPAALETNRRRLRFYENYGVRVVQGSAWESTQNPREQGKPTLLLFDPLGGSRQLRRKEVRAAVRRILVAQNGYEPDDPFVTELVASFRDDPVPLRPTRRASPPPVVAGSRIRPISVVIARGHEIHHVKTRGYTERPIRVQYVKRGLEGTPTREVAPKHFPDRHIREVHDPKLLHYLKSVCSRLDAKTSVYPEVFPLRRPDRAPTTLEGRAGYFCFDTFTPLTRAVYPAARQAVDVALTAAELVQGGERFAYAVCRPPGHHAERRVFGGFCYLNNSAIAAHFLSRGGRVALLDIDYHHGNGGQDIFWERDDVLTLSIHGHPRTTYPNFSGYADERGEGAGLGFNRNWPLSGAVDEARYRKVLGQALAAIRSFSPEYLVVSLGFDLMKGDPTGGFDIGAAAVGRIAEDIAGLGLPTLMVQEGGYSARNLTRGTRSFVGALVKSWYA